MQVILKEDVAHLGSGGDQVEVKGGYGRNYLIPRGLAIVASSRNIRQVNDERQRIAKRREKQLADVAALKNTLDGLSVNIPMRVGSDDKLFGSVTNKDIQTALSDQGNTIDRKMIIIDTPIRSLGVHEVRIALGGAVECTIKVWVVAAE